MVNLEPVVYVLRVYANEDGFRNKEPYLLSATVLRHENRVYIKGLTGTLTRKAYREIKKALRDVGITTIVAIRHGQPVLIDTYDNVGVR